MLQLWGSYQIVISVCINDPWSVPDYSFFNRYTQQKLLCEGGGDEIIAKTLMFHALSNSTAVWCTEHFLDAVLGM